MRLKAGIVCGFLATVPAFADTVWIGKFAPSDSGVSAPWKIERFDERVAPTRYRYRRWDGVDAVEAQAKKSMAVLARSVEVNLDATPFLCWRWRVEAPVATADIRTKAGDDYAARIYLMFRVPDDALDFSTRTKLAFARTLHGGDVPDAAINYVWDNRSPVGTVLPNAYTNRAMMWVLRSGNSEAGRWVNERRDVRADFRRAFGHPPAKLYAIALATDTDNTGGEATAGFADLKFVASDQACG